jgi:L-ascorbate metabolism protein UlaG (beta-lactamase superfamily)
MRHSSLRFTYVGGPTALLEIAGLRLLTDPTFDGAGTEYPTPIYTLRKTQGPAVPAETLGAVDVVLLSHDHHFDNFDHGGRRILGSATSIVTTSAGAGRIGRKAIGLEPWQSHDVTAPDGRILRITGTPARHGPAGGDRGPVIGFVLTLPGPGGLTAYITGDSVWYEGVEEVGRRFAPDLVLLFAGAARVREVGPAHLTFTAAEAVLAARAFAEALIVPLHYEGWSHFSESRRDLEQAFAAADLSERLRLPRPGEPLDLTFGGSS